MSSEEAGRDAFLIGSAGPHVCVTKVDQPTAATHASVERITAQQQETHQFTRGERGPSKAGERAVVIAGALAVMCTE
jgi:hypothetical protein